MSDEQNNESKNLKKKKIEVYEKNADGWLKERDGIFKHPSKNIYDVRVYRRIKVDANKPPKQIFKRARNITSLLLAIQKRNELMEELSQLAIKHEGKDATWGNACEEYFGRLEARYKDRKISFNTMDTTISTLKKHTAIWNKKWLSDFTSEQIENFINSEELKKNDEEKVKSATRMNILKFIRGVFKFMVDRGRMKHNPAMGIYIRGKKKLNYPTVMKHNEMIALIDYAKTVNQDWADVYTVAYLTGARSGELYSMKWENVDWENRLLFIRENYDWKTETHQPTKGKKDRTVPINLDLLECFLGLRGKHGEYILPRIQDWKNGKSAQIIRQFQKALKIRQTKFHGIRGTFITNLLLQGVPVIKVQAIVGHDDLKTTLMYVGMLAEETKGATDVLTLKPENKVATLSLAELRRIPADKISKG